MTPQELRERTKQFAQRTINFVDPLLADARTRDMGLQLMRAATSVASNYRAAGRARSHAEFTSKVGLVLEEADEVELWLEFLKARPGVSETTRAELSGEASQLVAIFAAAKRTATRRDPPRRR